MLKLGIILVLILQFLSFLMALFGVAVSLDIVLLTIVSNAFFGTIILLLLLGTLRRIEKLEKKKERLEIHKPPN